MDNPHILFQDDRNRQTIVFEEPSELLFARNCTEVFRAFKQLEKARTAGKWAAGFLAYEAGYCFEEKLCEKIEISRETPLLCFGIFDEPRIADSQSNASISQNCKGQLTGFQPGWEFSTYKNRFFELREHIAKGDCYQANLTFPMDGTWQGNPRQIFDNLTGRQPVQYGAYVALTEPVIVSRSPELFFKVDRDGWIETHPMKGTAPRQSSPKEDLREIENLKSNPKTQAENIMIVDLLRNDISRITEPGSLQVPRLFEVETYPSVHQMISCVRGRLCENTRIQDVFAALFPCGSITGAPKLSAMEILHKLEDGPRGIYCGAIGYIGPGKQMLFNVAIRTLALFSDGHARLNVGGGIIWDSEVRSEYDEALMKAKFVTG